MLFIHQIHRVVGKRAAEFEQAQREWMAALGDGDDARLLWYLDHAHGSGRSYQVITITAVSDGASWQRLVDRVRDGDLQAWARRLDGLQHDASGRVLREVDWSPFEVSLADVATDGAEHPRTLYMEDTMWPRRGQLDRYLAAAGTVYSKMLGAHDKPLLSIEAAWTTVPGAGVSPEVTLMQKIHDVSALVALLTHELPPDMARPGSWMYDALEYRDQWRSKVLRTAPWSPCY